LALRITTTLNGIKTSAIINPATREVPISPPTAPAITLAKKTSQAQTGIRVSRRAPGLDVASDEKSTGILIG